MPVRPGRTWSLYFRALFPATRVEWQRMTKWSSWGAPCDHQLWWAIPHILPRLTVELVQSFIFHMRNERVSKAHWPHSASSLNLFGLPCHRWSCGEMKGPPHLSLLKSTSNGKLHCYFHQGYVLFWHCSQLCTKAVNLQRLSYNVFITFAFKISGGKSFNGGQADLSLFLTLATVPMHIFRFPTLDHIPTSFDFSGFSSLCSSSNVLSCTFPVDNCTNWWCPIIAVDMETS